MSSVERHPALILGVLGAASGALGAFWLSEPVIGALSARVASSLAGLSFGCVISYAVWRWGARSLLAFATALIGVLVGWHAAVYAAVHLEMNVLSGDLKSYAAGAVAGAIGGMATWAASAVGLPALRQWQASILVVSAGALLGLLLPLTNRVDNPLILLAPWQAGVAALIAWRLGSEAMRANRAMAVDAERA